MIHGQPSTGGRAGGKAMDPEGPSAVDVAAPQGRLQCCSQPSRNLERAWNLRCEARRWPWASMSWRVGASHSS